jgi:peptidoglycan hydrolase CwlO-like protein
MEIVAFLRDWVIPVIAVLLSVWFAASAKRDSDNAQQILKQINEAIQGWQSEIMKASTELLNTMPQIVDGKLKIADAKTRSEALELLINTIKKKLEDGHNAVSVEAEAINALANIARQVSGPRE